MLIKALAAASLLLLLAGCATPSTYIYGTQTYYSPEALQGAIDADLASALSNIQPLPAPLTHKQLIFAIPSQSAHLSDTKNHFIKNNGHAPQGDALISMENIVLGHYKSARAGYAILQKRNIYASIQMVEMQAMTGEFTASPETDALYFTQASPDSGQWFYVSDKHGKQIFAHDHSDPTTLGKFDAFIKAVQAQAIRE